MSVAEQTRTAKAATPAPKIMGVHHSAFRCRDAEETRKFYEDVLGLRTKATLAFDKLPGTDQTFHYMHLFFEMGDGNFIAFFDVPHTADETKFGIKDGIEDYHFAMEVGSYDELMQFKQRLEEHGLQVFGPIDHKFCHSIYFHDPNGIALEFTTKDAKHNEILDEEEKDSPAIMEKWNKDTAKIREDALKASAKK